MDLQVFVTALRDRIARTEPNLDDNDSVLALLFNAYAPVS